MIKLSDALTAVTVLTTLPDLTPSHLVLVVLVLLTCKSDGYPTCPH
jgi:hypothetical protein